jgi:hypothetical protein
MNIKRRKYEKNLRFKKYFLKVVDNPVKWQGNELLYYLEDPVLNLWENQKGQFFPDYAPHQEYIKMLHENDCPINYPNNIMDLFYNPYYQLMRQTLLGWKMTKLDEYDCDEYINLHIIPHGNTKLRENTTTPMDWKNILIVSLVIEI